jgi:hypothetical protein
MTFLTWRLGYNDLDGCISGNRVVFCLNMTFLSMFRLVDGYWIQDGTGRCV